MQRRLIEMKVYYKPFLNSSQIFKVAIGRNIFSKNFYLCMLLVQRFSINICYSMQKLESVVFLKVNRYPEVLSGLNKSVFYFLSPVRSQKTFFVFQDVLKTGLQDIFQRRLQGVFKTSSRSSYKTFSRSFELFFTKTDVCW